MVEEYFHLEIAYKHGNDTKGVFRYSSNIFKPFYSSETAKLCLPDLHHFRIEDYFTFHKYLSSYIQLDD